MKSTFRTVKDAESTDSVDKRHPSDAMDSLNDEKHSPITTQASDAPDAPPPNGGRQAWLQVLGAHFLFFNAWGIVNIFGAFQDYYTTELLPNYSSSTISWIGTFQGFLLLLIGVVTGPIFDKGYFRHLVIGGSFLVVFGMMMTSLATEYYQLFLAQGLVMGLGCGALFTSSIAIVPQYFTTKRALASGIVFSGGSIGAVIYAVVFRRLQPRIGFGWTVRVIGFLQLATLLVSIAIMKVRRVPKHSRALFDISAWKSPSFVTFTFGIFCTFIGLYLPFFYIPIYATNKLGVSVNLGFYLLCVLNAGSAFGRVIPGFLADRFGPLNSIIFCTGSAAILAYCRLAIHDLASLIVFCVLYGFFSGAAVSLPATVITAIVPDIGVVGTWLGMCYMGAGLGLLVGTPVAGKILNVAENKFSGAQIFCASFLIAGTGSWICVRLWRSREKGGWKM